MITAEEARKLSAKAAAKRGWKAAAQPAATSSRAEKSKKTPAPSKSTKAR
jgi:hypothetical protein